MPQITQSLSQAVLKQLTVAARDKSRINSSTHNFYRYPARFSPVFAAAAIQLFSRPGDLVLDPYMGGGTTAVEAMLAGRNVVGSDLNSLAVFVANVKTTPLNAEEIESICAWADEIIPGLNYHMQFTHRTESEDRRQRNLSLVRARFLKKIIAIALSTLDILPTKHAQDFVRCAILSTGQSALDGRRSHMSLSEFRIRLAQTVSGMLTQIQDFAHNTRFRTKTLINTDTAHIHEHPFFASSNNLASLVVTSPPYPGVHVLYHRWQVDGRRESPAPYWIANCTDGQGASYYNFGDRHQARLSDYFEASLRTLKAIRRVMRPGAYIIQMVAFSNPYTQLRRYLQNMLDAGFRECKVADIETANSASRIWRIVPNRKWHATIKGNLKCSKEVVFVHVAL